MYNASFGFKEKPFKLVPNPDFLFLGKSNEEALEQQDEPRLSMGLNIRSEKKPQAGKVQGPKEKGNPMGLDSFTAACFLGAGAFMTLFSHDKPPQTKMPPPREQEPQEIALTKPAPGETQKIIIPMDSAAPPEPSDLTLPAMAKALPPAIAEEPPEPTLAVTHENRNSKIDKANETDNFNDIPNPRGTPSLNEIPILNDNSLIINAIAWSNDPGKRLAVINSAIVRQGQSIEGFLAVTVLGGEGE
jgi:hypothetical protein